jgi:hypothetical protein
MHQWKSLEAGKYREIHSSSESTKEPSSPDTLIASVATGNTQVACLVLASLPLLSESYFADCIFNLLPVYVPISS